MRLLLSDRGDQIVSIVSVDPDSVSAALSEGGKNGPLKLEQYFNLKFCMPDVSSMEIGKG